MDDVRMPIQTIKVGNKITKNCVEDVYKIVNRVYEAMDKAYNSSVEILENEVKKEVPIPDEKDTVWEGYLINGTGTSQPCMLDAFDEEIGNNIAFMKAKLNANIKKHNFLIRIWNNYVRLLDSLNKDIVKIDDNIKRDLAGIRKHNQDYLSDAEIKLGI